MSCISLSDVSQDRGHRRGSLGLKRPLRLRLLLAKRLSARRHPLRDATRSRVRHMALNPSKPQGFCDCSFFPSRHVQAESLIVCLLWITHLGKIQHATPVGARPIVWFRREEFLTTAGLFVRACISCMLQILSSSTRSTWRASVKAIYTPRSQDVFD